MIDEKRLIEEVEDMMCPFQFADETREWALKDVIEVIEEQPKVGEWIPVEERLPEQSLNSVIGWDAYRERLCFVQYYMNEWILGNHETVKIVAWMPLPEPYKKEA